MTKLRSGFAFGGLSKLARAVALVTATAPFAGGAVAAEPAGEPLRVGKTFIASATDPAQGSAGWALVSPTSSSG